MFTAGYLRKLVPCLLLSTVLAACQRPFADEGTAGITLVSPDLSAAVLDPEITLRIQARYDFSQVTRVDLNSQEMQYDNVSDTWSTNLVLQTGLNRFVVSSYVENGDPGSDTLYALHLPYEIDPSSSTLPIPVGGHTATLRSNGDLLIVGGSETATGEATDRIQEMKRLSGGFSVRPERLLHARVGHTTIDLGNGRLLIVGGARQRSISTTRDLVEEVELFSDETDGSHEVPVIGEPIRRMNHTGSYRTTPDGTVIDLIGGIGDVLYSPEPELGVRPDLRSFLLRNDTLYALSPAIGPTIEPMEGQSQTPLEFLTPGQAGRYFLAGFYQGGDLSPSNLIVDFGSPLGISVDRASDSPNPSIFHAAARLEHHVLGFFGGLDPRTLESTGRAEVFFYEIDRHFILSNDPSGTFFSRYGHTATIVGPNRILVIGGFAADGSALKRALVFTYAL